MRSRVTKSMRSTVTKSRRSTVTKRGYVMETTFFANTTYMSSPHYYPSKISILSYTLVTLYIPIICIIILTINIFNRTYMWSAQSEHGGIEDVA